MIKDLLEDMQNKLNSIMDETQEKIERELKGKLWVSNPKYKMFYLFGGNYQDVKTLYQLVRKKSHLFEDGEFDISPYNVKIHGPLSMIDAAGMFKNEFRPKTSGDIIEYNGKIYEVFGFSSNGNFGIIEIKDNGERIHTHLSLSPTDSFKMIYSKYYDYHIKDRVKNLYQ